MFLTAAFMAPSSAHGADWRERLTKADSEFSQVPFWFWNDELNNGELKRQLADFREHGVYGVVIHARMGLPKSIPYMGERWLGHVRFVVEEAARTGMRVCLYDEGMYPSGSAHGAVVRSNPAFAAQALAVGHKDVTGPKDVAPPAVSEGTLVAIVAARRTDEKGTLDLTEAQVFEQSVPTVKLPEGEWRVMTFTQVPSKGHIRGVHEGEEDGQPNAPAAADLLSYDAMKAFIRFAYEPYHETLEDHFGKTAFAMFTDEPSLLGRGHRRAVKPWTAGLAEDYEERRGTALLPLLPALFFEAGDLMHKTRDDFALTLAERFDETYYQPLSKWCEQRGIALTGHSAGSDEIRPLRHFQLPGQDLVWRYVVPDGKSGLVGRHSTTGKCSSSVARHDGRRRNGNEVYGAYGWDLTMEEMKWLADWLMVRGVNLLYPHAFYYSIRDFRVHERPPDLGMHNAWWPHYRLFADYTSRLCGLLTDSRQVCDVAVLSLYNRLPWRAAKWLFQHQVDFNYLEGWRMLEQARIEDGEILIGDMRYSTLIIDQNDPLGESLAERIQAFEEAGGTVRYCRSAPTAALVTGLARDVTLDPADKALRYVHLVKEGVDYYLFTNEGDEKIAGTVSVRSVGRAQWFDAWSGGFAPATVTRADAATMSLRLRLGRRESVVLCIEPGRPTVAAPDARTELEVEAVTQIQGPWKVLDADGKPRGGELGDWLTSPATADFAGTLRYTTTFRVKQRTKTIRRLDLGRVGDWAVVHLNGKCLGPRFWAPYAWDVTKTLRAGENELTVEVTNSLANRYAPKKRRSSGLFGPVVIRDRVAR